MSQHFLISQPTEGETAVGAPTHIAFPKTFTIESARRRNSVPALSPPISDGHQIAIGFHTLSIHVSDQKAKKGKPGSAEEEISKFDFHLVTVDEIHQRFNSTPEKGLEQSAASSRLQRYGKNIITPPKDDVFLKLLGYLFGGFCPVLWTASLVCFLAWQPLGTPPDPMNFYLAIVLILVIMLQAAFTAYQDWTTAKVMSSINSLLPAEAMVIRDNIRQKVPTPNLVAGDIVVLSLGTKVPADLRLVSVTEDLKFDRSILTGEVDPVSGSINATDDNYLETRNIALTGTLVTNGAATGVVVTTGDKTVMGRIAQLSVGQAPEPPLLQMEIMRFVRIVIVLAVVTAVVVLVVWAAWLRTFYPTFLSLSAILVNVIGIMVAFVPEGMPVTVTLTLTAVARQMAKHKILCKVLTTVETLGSVNVIASDKTGTLTENKMFVTKIGFTESEPQGIATKDCRHILVARTNRDVTFLVRQLRTAAALCNGASFDVKTLDQPVYQRKTNGDATDSALLRFAEDLKMDDNDSDFEKIHEIPFNSRNKWMLSLYRCKDSKASEQLPVSDARQDNAFNCGNGDLVMITKGAPDVLLPKCSSYLDASGNQKELTENAIDNVTKLQEHWSSDGQRVLVLTRRIFTDDKDLPRSVEDYSSLSDVIEKANTNLTVIGLIGIVDPPRPEIKDVIARCRLAGIRVFMVTGDFRLTAVAIAKQVGIFSPDTRIDDFENIQSDSPQTYRNEDDPSTDYNAQVTSLVMTGLDLAGGNLTDNHWDKIANYSEVVFARTTPEQKLRIVTEFRKRGNIVGVTGDGVNDAPALKAAHIGVAMGAGSEVAMAAGAMILLDSNFSSMLVAIEYGRLVFENLKKVILYLLPAGSWSELWPVLFNVFFGLPLPLSTFLMIIICLFTDLFPSLAMINEMPESDLMLRKPRNPKKERLVDAKLLFHAYGFIGFMETACALGMYFQYLTSHGGFAGSDLFLAFDQWTDGYKGKTQVELNELLYTAQSVYFLTLVILQFGNLIATRTRYTSLVKSNPWKTNPYLFTAMFASAAVAVVVLYIPFFNNAFNTRPVSYVYWLIPLGLAIGIVIMEELRKLAVVCFPRSIVARMAW